MRLKLRAMAGVVAAGALALAGTALAAPGPATTGRTADNNGVKIHYEASGAGPLVVLVHGFPDYWGTWKPLMAALNAAGYRTAALDLRGYDLSDKPKGVANYAMPLLVEDVAAVARAEGARNIILVGHDWGAAISWNVAIAHPDLVSRLVILSVPHPTLFARALQASSEQKASSGYAREFQKPGSETHLTAEGLAGWVKDPTDRLGYVEAFKRSDLAGMMNYYRANYPGADAPAAPPPPPVPPIAAPVMVIHGLKDQALRAAGHSGTWDMVASDTTLLMIPTAGHFVQHDAEALVDRSVVDWLNARPLAGC